MAEIKGVTKISGIAERFVNVNAGAVMNISSHVQR
jgi:hypothetical protein